MRAEWTASGACSSGSTAPPKGATRRASGGAATTSTRRVERSRGCRGATAGLEFTTHVFRWSLPASLFWRLSAALRCQRGGNDRLVRVHVGDGRDADDRRLDDVDGVDADARTDVARRRGVVPWHVGRDDGGDDAAVLGPNAVALPPGRWQNRRDAPRSAERARGRGLLCRLDRVRNGRFSARRGAGDDRDAAAGAGARRTHRGRCGRPDRRLPPAHRDYQPRGWLSDGAPSAAPRKAVRNRRFLESGRPGSNRRRPAWEAFSALVQ